MLEQHLRHLLTERALLGHDAEEGICAALPPHLPLLSQLPSLPTSHLQAVLALVVASRADPASAHPASAQRVAVAAASAAKPETGLLEDDCLLAAAVPQHLQAPLSGSAGAEQVSGFQHLRGMTWTGPGVCVCVRGGVGECS